MTVTKLGKDIENSGIAELGTDARTSHTEVIGATRSGKTTLLKSIFWQDIMQGRGALQWHF
jgi:type IV secretory pathway VirB4 component